MKQRAPALGFLLLLTAAGTFAQPAKSAPGRNPPLPRNELRPGAPGRNPPRNPDGAKGNGAARLANPLNPVERLMAMSPEMRERVLEKLPAQQQANLRERLDRFDKLPAAERARLNRMWATFNSLPPETQASVTRQMQAFNALPEDRRRELRPVLQRLRNMPEDRRNRQLGSEAFKNRFSPAELEMLTEISRNYPLPGR
ncbi:MAG: DUF3106 domain-containing protein [Candidatus Solibacter sp.]